jgi:hypothetical protein
MSLTMPGLSALGGHYNNMVTIKYKKLRVGEMATIRDRLLSLYWNFYYYEPYF